MSDSNQSAVIDVTPSGAVAPDQSVIAMLHIIYALFALGILGAGVLYLFGGHLAGGLFWIAGLIAAYVKRDDAKGTWAESHFGWIIRTFWWGVLWSILCGVLVFVLVMLIITIPIAILVWAIPTIWAIYRIAKGWMNVLSAKPVG
jgi:uncharacterized membrane protein